MPQWKARYPGVETLNVAVMGCIVNGPGESKHADIGISLPGTGETPAAPVFVDGVKTVTLARPDDRRGIQAAGRGLRRETLRRPRRRGRIGRFLSQRKDDDARGPRVTGERALPVTPRPPRTSGGRCGVGVTPIRR